MLRTSNSDSGHVVPTGSSTITVFRCVVVQHCSTKIWDTSRSAWSMVPGIYSVPALSPCRLVDKESITSLQHAACRSPTAFDLHQRRIHLSPLTCAVGRCWIILTRNAFVPQHFLVEDNGLETFNQLVRANHVKDDSKCLLPAMLRQLFLRSMWHFPVRIKVRIPSSDLFSIERSLNGLDVASDLDPFESATERFCA